MEVEVGKGYWVSMVLFVSGEIFKAELLNIGCYPAQWARQFETILRGIETAAEVFHCISEVIVQMLPYYPFIHSITCCGYQLFSVIIGYPANFFKQRHAMYQVPGFAA